MNNPASPAIIDSDQSDGQVDDDSDQDTSRVSTEAVVPPPELAPPTGKGIYARLAAPFDVHFTDIRGGVALTYISGEQVVRRLNEVLGVEGWSFKVMDHGINAEADEVWALVDLSADINGKTVTRQQFGSQKLKRSRANGSVLDIGFDLKGATTDAMKKCATLLGVGLYLSQKIANPDGSARTKDAPKARPVQQQQTTTTTAPKATTTRQQAAPRQAPTSKPATQGTASSASNVTPIRPPAASAPAADSATGGTAASDGIQALPGSTFDCEECGQRLTEQALNGGGSWSPADLAAHGKHNFGRILCGGDYGRAHAAARAAKAVIDGAAAKAEGNR